MNLTHTLSGATVATSVLSLTVLLGGPAQAETLRLANNHTGGEMMNTTQQTDSGMSIVDVASSNDSFNTLVQAVQAANLTDTLSGEGPYTVFAPTDAAFDQLPDGALEFLLQPENQDLLAEVLTYHVVPGSIMASELSTGGVDTLNGGIAVGVSDAGVVVNNASVINPNIEASNGVIHSINRVLIPESLQQQLAARLGVADIY